MASRAVGVELSGIRGAGISAALHADGAATSGNVNVQQRSTTMSRPSLLVTPLQQQHHDAAQAFKAARAHVAFDLPSVKTKKRSDFILLPNGAFKPWWDLLVVLLVIYSAFSLPVFLCFDVDTSATAGWDLFVDVVFYCDVVIYFFTAYDKGGVMIFSRKRIASHYLRSWFLVDLVACLPWEELSRVVSGASAAAVIKVLRGCKALRLLRLNRLFKFLDSHQLMGYLLRMLRMLFVFFLLAHWVACIWFALGASASSSSDGVEGWLAGLTPPLDPRQDPFLDLYLTSLYWVITTWISVGYGDIVAKTDAEKCFAMGAMVLGAVVYASIFGTVALLLQSLGRLDNIFKAKLESVNSYMADLGLPLPLQVRVRNYYSFLWARHKSFSPSNQLDELPPSLTNQIAHFLHQDTIDRCEIFKNAEEAFLRAVTTRLKFCVSLPGDYIFREDEPGDKFFLLRKGRVEISSDEEGVLTFLEEGALFGEIAILLPPSASSSAAAAAAAGGAGAHRRGGSGSSSGGSSSGSVGHGSRGSVHVHGSLDGRDVHDAMQASTPEALRRKRSASARSLVSSDMYYLAREELLVVLALFPQYRRLFVEIAKQRLKQTALHRDQMLVEKILEMHAKKGWLRLKGHKKQNVKTAHTHTPAQTAAMGRVVAAMVQKSPASARPAGAAAGAAAAVGGTAAAPASRAAASPGSASLSSAVAAPPPGRLLRAKLLQHRDAIRQMAAATAPAQPASPSHSSE